MGKLGAFGGIGLIGGVALIILFLVTGSRTCGNVYDDIVDKKAAVLAHDTVPSLRPDTTRSYTFECVQGVRENKMFLIVGIIALIAGAVALVVGKLKAASETPTPRPRSGGGGDGGPTGTRKMLGMLPVLAQPIPVFEGSVASWAFWIVMAVIGFFVVRWAIKALRHKEEAAPTKPKRGSGLTDPSSKEDYEDYQS